MTITHDDLYAWVTSLREELRDATKEELIDFCILQVLKNNVHQHVIQPKYSEAVLDAPKQLAKRGAQARAQKEADMLAKKFAFLFKQLDISHTEGLARRLDREFGIKGRQPREDEAASRASKDVVRDWNRFRSTSKTEETSGAKAQKEPKET